MTDEQPTEQFTARLEPVPVPRRPRRPRSFPLWPVVVGALAIALLIVTSVLIATLNRPDAAPDQVAPVTNTATPVPTTAPATEEAAPPPAAPRPEAGLNQCVDELGDAGAMDLDTVTLEMRDGDLTVRFELAAALPAGESGVGLVTERRNKRETFQVSIAFRDGRLDRYFLWDGDDEHELDLDDVRVEGTTIVAIFPDDELDRLGDRWRWSAFAAAAGSELDSCPAAGEWLEFVRDR